MKKFLLLFLLPFSGLAQVDSIRMISEKSIRENLKEGTNQYLVFSQNKKKSKQTHVGLWSRTVKFKTFSGKEVIEITQRWFDSDTSFYRSIYSLMDRKTFLPIHHRTWMQRTGVEAFDFYPNKIMGSDSVVNNSRKGFSVSLSQPMLNWELDMETFGLLPLAANKTFAINFYHPGSKSAPATYEYKVIGDAVLTSMDGSSVPCWKLKIDYSKFGPDSWAIFYISKKGKEMLKMEEQFGQGIRYKVKLPTTIQIF